MHPREATHERDAEASCGAWELVCSRNFLLKSSIEVVETDSPTLHTCMRVHDIVKNR